MKKQKPIDHAAIRRKAAELAIEKLCGPTEAAAKTNSPSRQSVQSWLTSGVPVRYCLVVNELTGIPLQDLRSGDWQNYWPQSN